ncbi:Signal transducer regulating beta-lactamase production, contains metallopeptidase domain [Mucilaginibacter gossypiicola]|uniref:Signal transducer regulating beta-lactamase production, contains metallopeptidase domain n=1 Tax=Mucilaginibacter gossypiicola TaxID=551995 RepID=A0A1H8RIP3_9SPHI|nr:M56 family metallopeptidase [Mucilaginibacter gossypiicola]SEO66117.1 Signal transducer regulating beta-lactamase production, contains metallopeptidase domain [Mucilaginibacter gossypiicola]
MENLFYNISQVLGVTILQSLWQGLLVWFALRLVFICRPQLSAIKKHNWAMGALLTISAWFIYTFIHQFRLHEWINYTSANAPSLLPRFYLPLHEVAAKPQSNYYEYVIKGYLPYISALYFVGLVFNLLKVSLSWQKISLIKRTMVPADRLQDFADELCQKLGIKKSVWVNFSRMVDAPCMIGFLSPIILLPITLTTYLSATEVEAILLHELSHIKRNDYLLNLMQQFISILLFFNPFAQLINRIINQERENSCDDLVVATTQQPLIYAHALLKLEQTRQQHLQLALAANGKKYHLLNRIERIMKTKKPIGNIRHLLVAIAIMTAGVSSIAWLNPTIKDGKLTVKKVTAPAALHAIFIEDTTHKVKAKKAVTYKKKTAAEIVKAKQRHDSFNYDGFNDAELEKLSAEVSKQGELIGKYYASDSFKKQQEMIEAKSKALQAYYNTDAMEKMKLEMEKMGEDFQKEYGETSESKKTSEQMGEIGRKIGAYYSSPDFKKMNSELEKKYGIPHNRGYNGYNDDRDPNYKKYQDELQSKIPADVKEQTELLKTLGQKIRSRYDSPEFVAKRDRMQAMGDSLRLAYDNPDIKKLQEDMKNIGRQMRVYQDSPEIRAAQQRLKEASKKLQDYMKSPAFKQKMKLYRDKMDKDFDYKFDNDKLEDIKPDTAD